MLVNQSNWEDVKKYYEKTYVKFPALTSEQLWFIDRVTPEYIEVRSTNGDEAAIDLKKDYELDFVIPKKTVYQYGDQAVMLQRIPARQWKKGMCKNNTAFKMLGENGWVQGPFDPQIIEGFINKPSYFPIYTAINRLQIKEDAQPDLISAAITPRITINRRGNIFVDEVVVAKYQDLKSGPQLTVKNIFAPDLVPHFYKKVTIKTL